MMHGFGELRGVRIKAFRCVVHLQSTLVLLRTTKKPGLLKNTVSVGVLKFCKSIHCAVSKSESDLGDDAISRLPLLQVAIDNIPPQFVLEKPYIIIIKGEKEITVEGTIKITDGPKRKEGIVVKEYNLALADAALANNISVCWVKGHAQCNCNKEAYKLARAKTSRWSFMPNPPS
ncbi:hypothetical protein NQ318_003168 [Aromia moschata]|uniref:RNase H type-1 domain-containing protein n=1 Tax=Aromia moschata TaxID=1265417 RepID=A0AAV8X452_9CUCU|nr:hypothetical protein NQ318_003168 [Aromia moschata]